MCMANFFDARSYLHPSVQVYEPIPNTPALEKVHKLFWNNSAQYVKKAHLKEIKLLNLTFNLKENVGSLRSSLMLSSTFIKVRYQKT
jgi:hypothetical protein